MTEPAISLANLTLGYDQYPAVHHLSGQFDVGSLTAVVGPNGAGKSTLLKSMMGMLVPLEGDINLVSCSRSEMALLPQQAQLDTTFPISVLDTVCLGFYQSSRQFGTITSEMVVQASLATFYVLSLAIGVLLLSHGTDEVDDAHGVGDVHDAHGVGAATDAHGGGGCQNVDTGSRPYYCRCCRNSRVLQLGGLANG